MYSMVLMAALAAGGDAPDCWRSGGCTGGGCHGYSCGGGCYGGYSYGCYGNYSYGGYGCSGYSYGCYGSYSYGGYGCSGSCGGWGASYGCSGGWSCHGCYGCWGCYGGVSPYAQPVIGPVREVVPPPKTGGTTGRVVPTRAKLIVELPADAKLYIDDQKMNSTSERRVFNTPQLELGECYFYMLRAEVVKDGKPVSVTKRVILKPGEEITADFKDLAAPTVTTVKLQ
jgi:uncharacterized protein (TIGR03000 family)